jgi:hypothetical protein
MESHRAGTKVTVSVHDPLWPFVKRTMRFMNLKQPKTCLHYGWFSVDGQAEKKKY